MKKKQPMYLWQCIECKEYIYSEDVLLKHCHRLVQWIKGIEGKGINMASPKVRIKVSGHIEMSQESLNTIMEYNDPHTGLVYAIHMGYVDASNLEFEQE
jgi:hypothetical protein